MKLHRPLAGLIAASVLAVCSLVAADDFRDFKNLEGVVIRAKVMAIQGTNVKIRRVDGREFTLGIDKLSLEDQAYLKDWKPASSTSSFGKKEDLTIGPPPSRLDLAGFYKKHVDYDGLPIVSSEKVPDKARNTTPSSSPSSPSGCRHRQTRAEARAAAARRALDQSRSLPRRKSWLVKSPWL